MDAKLQDIAKRLRVDILQATHEAGGCHLGSALSCLPILVDLFYGDRLKDGDTFIFSKASGVAAHYAILADKGFFPKEKLSDYIHNYPLPSKEVPGVVHSMGSIGHGLNVAAGIAWADREHNVYVLCSDGELQEGSTWEAIWWIAHHGLSNLIMLVDNNRFQACGKVEEVSGFRDIWAILKEFGWNTSIYGSNSMFGTPLLVEYKHKDSPSPLCVVWRTTKGDGVSFMENNNNWHYFNLTEDLLNKAIAEQDGLTETIL